MGLLNFARKKIEVNTENPEEKILYSIMLDLSRIKQYYSQWDFPNSLNITSLENIFSEAIKSSKLLEEKFTDINSNMKKLSQIIKLSESLKQSKYADSIQTSNTIKSLEKAMNDLIEIISKKIREIYMITESLNKILIDISNFLDNIVKKIMKLIEEGENLADNYKKEVISKNLMLQVKIYGEKEDIDTIIKQIELIVGNYYRILNKEDNPGGYKDSIIKETESYQMSNRLNTLLTLIKEKIIGKEIINNLMQSSEEINKISKEISIMIEEVSNNRYRKAA